MDWSECNVNYMDVLSDFLLCRIFSDRMILTTQYHANFIIPFLKSLSHTEKKLLLLLANGMHLKKATAQINIKYGYACNVMERLRAKFGGVSREQLFYTAGTMHFHHLIG